MIRSILILGLVVFFVPSLAGAGEFEECEVELHDDGSTEVSYENDVTGFECTVIIAPATTPTAEAQACIALCEALLPEPPPAMCTNELLEFPACEFCIEGRFLAPACEQCCNGGLPPACQVCPACGVCPCAGVPSQCQVFG